MCKVFFAILLGVTQAVVASETTHGVELAVVYRDFGHKGDENQVRGVLKVLAPKEIKEFDLSQGQELKAFVGGSKKSPLVIAVGEKTVTEFANLLPLVGAKTVHLCHMLTPGHKAMVGKVDYIVLPSHAVGDFDPGGKTILIKTIGVSHNRQVSNVEQMYHDNKALVPESTAYLAVILAGDAPKPDGTILPFTESNVRALADYVAKNAANRHVVILNGPRTGKYHPETLEENKSAHRNGELDFITAAFVDELRGKGVAFTVLDFQFGDTRPTMDVVLGAIRATPSEILVPGESTSSISEAIDTVQPGKVTVYANSAMNDVHKAHVASELAAGRIKYLPDGFDAIQASEAAGCGVAVKSAAETVAAALLLAK